MLWRQNYEPVGRKPSVDFAYNSGCSKAIKKIQKVVGTKEDGIIGKNTLAAINNFKQGQWVLFDKLKIARVTYLNDIVKNATETRGQSEGLAETCREHPIW